VPTLILTKVWLNLLSTGEAVSAQSSTGRSHGHAIPGEVRGYAGGRQRSFSAAGESTIVPFVLRDVSFATLITIRSWAGQAVQMRDHRGQNWAGVYFATDVVDRDYEIDKHDVSISLRTITYLDGV
jgi:hypothetical protein